MRLLLWCRLILPLLLAFGMTCELASQPQGNADQAVSPPSDDFSWKRPAGLDQLTRRSVWFTTYVDLLTVEDRTPHAVPLKSVKGVPFQVGLTHRSWCIAADEGTVTVELATGKFRRFNVDTPKNPPKEPITDCSDIFPTLKQKTLDQIDRALFSELTIDSNAPFGLGVAPPEGGNPFRLVPARSVAIDTGSDGVFKVGDVLFVPQLTLVKVTLPGGKVVNHDGYVMAVDRVGGCSGSKGMPDNCNINHLDYFQGRSSTDLLPPPLDSSPASPVYAYLVTDPAIIARLKAEHGGN